MDNTNRAGGLLLIQRLIFLLLLSYTVPLSACAEPTPYRAVYTADYKGLPISAQAIRELVKHDDGTYTLSSVAASFIAKLSESTRFKIEQGRLMPLHYELHRAGIGKKRDAVLDFNWQNHTVVNNVQSKPWTMDIPVGTQDKLLYQLMLREDLMATRKAGKPWPKLQYKIADGGKIKHYAFAVLGIEEIKTPLGKLQVLKVGRLRKTKDRSTIFWLSIAHDFLLIRFRQQQENGSKFELNIKSAEFNGQQL